MPVVLVTLIVSPVTPLVADAVGACALALYVNDVVVPHVTATLFAAILQLIDFAAVVPSDHCVFVVSDNVAVAV